MMIRRRYFMKFLILIKARGLYTALAPTFSASQNFSPQYLGSMLYNTSYGEHKNLHDNNL